MGNYILEMNALQREMKTLMNRGLKICEAIDVIADDPTERDRKAVIDAARSRYQCDEIQIDDNAVLSEGEGPGCFVQAWVWVDDELKTDGQDVDFDVQKQLGPTRKFLTHPEREVMVVAGLSDAKATLLVVAPGENSEIVAEAATLAEFRGSLRTLASELAELNGSPIGDAWLDIPIRMIVT